MVRPDIEAFNEDVNSAIFKLGELNCKWQLIRIDAEGSSDPLAFIRVFTAKRENSPDSYVFRLKIDNFPAIAPEVCIWDLSTNTKLTKGYRPIGSKGINTLFRTDWEHGNHLYAPYERRALQTHSNWNKIYGDLCWKSGDSITKILHDLSRKLNSNEYHGKG